MDVFEDTKKFFYDFVGEKRIIGRSLFGREIFAVKVGCGSPTGIAQYAIHGREWLTSYLAFYHAKRVGITGSLWLVPLANPDGALLSQRGLRSAPKAVRSRLRSMNKGGLDFSLWKANGRGVDLNVNFDALWGRGEKNAFVSGSENYVGEKPFSEAESLLLKGFTEDIRPDYTLSFHTKGETIFWRFGQKGLRAYRDYALAKALSVSTGYPLGESANSCGGYKDWCIRAFSIPSFTIEVGREEAKHPLKKRELSDVVAKCGDVLIDASAAIKRSLKTRLND